MGIIGVRQIVISGQGISTISTQYSSTGLPSATSIIFSCQQVTPEISYLQSLALFHIISFWSDHDPRGNQCSIIFSGFFVSFVYRKRYSNTKKIFYFLYSHLVSRISQDIIIWSPIANPNLLMIKFMRSDDKVHAFWWWNSCILMINASSLLIIGLLVSDFLEHICQWNCWVAGLSNCWVGDCMYTRRMVCPGSTISVGARTSIPVDCLCPTAICLQYSSPQRFSSHKVCHLDRS